MSTQPIWRMTEQEKLLALTEAVVTALRSVVEPVEEIEEEYLNSFQTEALELLEAGNIGQVMIDGRWIGAEEIKADWQIARRVIQKLAD
jgi:hypothetical protein